MAEHLRITAPLEGWASTAGGVRYFATIGGDAAATLCATALMRRLEGTRRGFGSLRVTARIGATAWQTSVFPQKDRGGATSWLLPIKAAVCKAESLTVGEAVPLALEF